MSVSLVQSAFAGGSFPTSLAFPSNVTAGNLLIVVTFRGNNTTSPGSVSDTLGNSWTQGYTYNPTSGFGQSSTVFWAVANASGANTVNVSFGGSGGNAFGIAELTGSTSWSQDAGGSTTSAPPPTLTASQANDLLITGTCWQSATSPSVTSPEAIIQTGTFTDGFTTWSGAFSWIQEPSSGSITSSLVAGSSSHASAYGSVAFKTATAYSATAQGLVRTAGHVSVVTISTAPTGLVRNAGYVTGVTISVSAVGMTRCAGYTSTNPSNVMAAGLVKNAGRITGVNIAVTAQGRVQCAGSTTAVQSNMQAVGMVRTAGYIPGVGLSVTAQGRVQCAGYAATHNIPGLAEGRVHCAGYIAGGVTIGVSAVGRVQCAGYAVGPLNGAATACLQGATPPMPVTGNPSGNVSY